MCSRGAGKACCHRRRHTWNHTVNDARHYRTRGAGKARHRCSVMRCDVSGNHAGDDERPNRTRHDNILRVETISDVLTDN